jgi:hypothetical protein
MHFNIDLLGDGRNHFHFHGHGHFSLDYDEVILDPSVLFYLTSHKVQDSKIVYYLPDNLIKLIERSKEIKEYQTFLKSFLEYFRYGYSRQIKENDWALFYQNVKSMTIKPISQENIKSNQQDNYYENYLKMFSDHNFYISMSPRMNFLGDCIAKIMEFSKQTGKLILSKSRKLANLLREKIISLELPKHLAEMPNHMDNGLRVKSELLNRIFDFQGGRTTKFFVAVCLGVGGFIHPAIGGIGVAFIFIDP